MVHKTGVHKCPECPKTFSRLEYVARHQRVKHLGIRAWSCPCGASYGRSDLLARHRRKCKAKTSKDSTHDNNGIDSQQDKNPSVASVVLRSDPSSIHPAASPSHHPGHDDDKEPPTYLEAISQKGPFTFPLNNPADDLHIHPTSASLDVSIRPPTPPSRSECRPVEEAPTSVPTPEAFRSGVDELSGVIPRENVSFEDDGGETTRGDDDDEDAGSNQGEDASGLDNSTSIVPVVRYSNPNFFISDVPRSSPFYLNPHIWVLAFMCQKSQGFTIPHMGSLSRYLSRATELICPVIPMIHVPTLRAANISIHLGYALSVAGAALENSEHALAFTDQSLSYKRTSVQNDFIAPDRSFSFRFELFQSLITYQFLGMFSRLQVQRDRALRFSPTIIRNFRDLACTEIVRNTPDYIHLALSGQLPLDTAWRLWVQYEVQKRTVFLVLISSLQLGGPYGCGVRLSEANVRLPCHEELWTAGSAEEWASAARRQALSWWLDNQERGGWEEVYDGYGPAVRHMQDVVGEQAMPLLSEALAALHLSSPAPHTLPDRPPPFPDIHRVGPARLTVRAHRLGRFAKTVILHARALSNQAAVTIPLLEPPNLNI